MLNPPYIRNLTARRTCRHDWRNVETGIIFQVLQERSGARSNWEAFEILAVLPTLRDTRCRALAIIRHLRTGRVFQEPLGKVWTGLDAGYLDGHLVGWTDQVGKAIRRHNRRHA